MLNRIVLMGRLTRDPELRKTQSDTPVCSFSLAVDRDYKKDGEKKETVPAYEGEPGAGFGAPPSGFTPNFGEENGELPF